MQKNAEKCRKLQKIAEFLAEQSGKKLVCV
jgi:hypothetical protein